MRGPTIRTSRCRRAQKAAFVANVASRRQGERGHEGPGKLCHDFWMQFSMHVDGCGDDWRPVFTVVFVSDCWLLSKYKGCSLDGFKL
jgi:hypothetical protein